MALERFPLLFGRGLFWSAARVALLALFGLTALHFLGRDFVTRVEHHRRNRSALVGIDDWSHHQLVFSQPSDPRQAERLQREPRFWHQWNMRGGAPIGRLVAAATGSPGFPARFSPNVSEANCGTAAQPDFLVFNTGMAGNPSHPAVIAYDNLYSSCGANHPNIYWQYNTGGVVKTAVVLSADGTRAAFVQSAGVSSAASLVVLKWSGSPTIHAALATLTADPSYPNCTAPCMTTVAFSGGRDDTASSPFYDYTHDALYAGDDNGSLHKFTNVFNGKPAESGAPFVTVSPGRALTSPVYDSTTGNIFVGDSAGILRTYTAAGTTVRAGAAAAAGPGSGAMDAPLIDSTSGKLYRTTDPQYHGAFDDIYFKPTSALSSSGHLYVCPAEGAAGSSEIYVSSHSREAPATRSLTECPAVTTIPGSASEWMVMRATADGIGTAAGGAVCAGKCLYPFGPPAPGSASATNATGASGAAGSAVEAVVPMNAQVRTQTCFTTFANQTCAAINK